jgi:hypothetical protein
MSAARVEREALAERHICRAAAHARLKPRAPAIARIAGAALVIALGCSAHAQRAPTVRVLFIGNSLTSANDLPGTLETVSRAAGGPRLECESVAFPNYSLEDHWNRGDAAKAIARGGWQTVILQQGPSALPESQVLLREYTRKFDARIRGVGAKTALYMVWPFSTRRGDFDGVKASYQAATRDVGGRFLPVGEAWRAVWRRDAKISLYGSDGFHPTPEATYLTALVIYQRLTGTNPTTTPPSIAIAPDRAAVLRQAAADVIAIQ